MRHRGESVSPRVPRAVALSLCLVLSASAVASPARADDSRPRTVRAPHRTCAYDESFAIVPVAGRPHGAPARAAAILAAKAKAFRDGLRNDVRDACEEGIPADVRPSLEARCEAPFASAALVSIACEGYVFAGGAHGTKSAWTTNLDLVHGRELRLNDLFRPGTAWEGVLDRLAAEGFDRAIGESDNEPTNQGIPAAADFVITRDGLRFYMENTAPFVVGSVHPVVPWGALGGYLRNDWRRVFLLTP